MANRKLKMKGSCARFVNYECNHPYCTKPIQHQYRLSYTWTKVLNFRLVYHALLLKKLLAEKAPANVFRNNSPEYSVNVALSHDNFESVPAIQCAGNLRGPILFSGVQIIVRNLNLLTYITPVVQRDTKKVHVTWK